MLNDLNKQKVGNLTNEDLIEYYRQLLIEDFETRDTDQRLILYVEDELAYRLNKSKGDE